MQVAFRSPGRVSSRRRLVQNILLVGLVFIFTQSLAVFAQEEQPPAQYVAARAALREKFGLRLNIVQSWSYEPVDFTDGIESCVAEAARTGVNAPSDRKSVV